MTTTCYTEDRRCPPAERTPLCDGHISAAERAVRLLVLDYGDLTDHLAKSLGVWGEGLPMGTADLPVPIRLDVEALQRHIYLLTVGWARLVAIRCGLSHPPVSNNGRVRHDGRGVSWAVMILQARVDVLARLEPVPAHRYPQLEARVERGAPRPVPPASVCGAQGALDLVATHDWARAVLGLTNLVRKLPGYCQHHDRATGHCSRRLFQDNGSDTVYCEAGHRMTRDDYERYGNLFLRTREAA